MTTPHNALPFGRRSYQEAVRQQRDCQQEAAADPGRQAAIDGLDLAIRKAYAVLGPDEANGTVQWTHANVHTEYARKP